MEVRRPEVRPQAEPGHMGSFLGLWRASLPTPSMSRGVSPGSCSTQGPPASTAPRATPGPSHCRCAWRKTASRP